MDPKDAVPPAGTTDTGTADASRAAARTRAVVALVRPCTPNRAVLAAAADLAASHGCALLVLGTLERMATDWIDGVDVAGPMLETAHGELFAACVEELWDRELVWGVNVLWGRVSTEMLDLSGRIDVVRVVHGRRGSPTLLRRLRRRITGRIERVLADLDLVVA